jgi:predicted alpha-1,2-mannosidase
MKRILKGALILILLLLLLPVLAVAGLVVKYQSIAGKKAGTLVTSAVPAPTLEEVDLFIGTGGWPWMGAHNSIAAQTPFGMVRLGPDTQSFVFSQRNFNRSGYYYGDGKIIGFSHTRLVGADAREGGVFRVFPTTGARAAKMRGKDRYTPFSHRDERAFPGYYAVRLPREDVLAEFTASPRAGFHRYTFDNTDTAHILLDVSSVLDGRAKDGFVQINPGRREVWGSNTIRGSFSGRYDGLTVHFAARFSQPFQGFGVWQGTQYTGGRAEMSGDDIGADFAFTPIPGQPIELRIALSYVSIENARANLEAEAGGRTFDAALDAAQAAWAKQLGAIHVTGGTQAQRRIFHTALYRAFQMPTTFTDVNGQYRGFDKEVHQTEGFTYYTDFSLWDTFRTVHPLYNLIAREQHRDMMVSLVEMAKAGGCLPRWPSGCGYTNCMFGTPADCAVSEAWLKGIRNFDIDTAYAKMRQTALEGKPAGTRFAGREGLEHHLRYGYLPYDLTSDSVAATLEYAWCDAALAGLAGALGKTEDAATFAEHAKWYRNLWNPVTNYFEPKDSQGNFSATIKHTRLTYIDPEHKYTEGFVEGSAEQWRYAVPHDPAGLAALFPSTGAFIAALENYLENATPGVGHWNPGGYYWHGNEPYIHAAYLFAAAGRPDLTQKWVRWIMEHKYADTYYGLDGNDDGGTLSSWYVFSALGFYPIAGTTRYYLGSPIFDHARIQIGPHTLTVIAENNAPENCYVQSVTLNGAPLANPWFEHDQIAEGGELKFVMTPTPR